MECLFSNSTLNNKNNSEEKNLNNSFQTICNRKNTQTIINSDYSIATDDCSDMDVKPFNVNNSNSIDDYLKMSTNESIKSKINIIPTYIKYLNVIEPYLEPIYTNLNFSKNLYLNNKISTCLFKTYVKLIRSKAFNYIKKLCIALKLKDITLFQSLQIIDKFYYKTSFKSQNQNYDIIYDWKSISLATLSISMKNNEMKLYSISKLCFITKYEVTSESILLAEKLIAVELNYFFCEPTLLCAFNFLNGKMLSLNINTNNTLSLVLQFILENRIISQLINKSIFKIYKKGLIVLKKYSFEILALTLLINIITKIHLNIYLQKTIYRLIFSLFQEDYIKEVRDCLVDLFKIL